MSTRLRRWPTDADVDAPQETASAGDALPGTEMSHAVRDPDVGSRHRSAEIPHLHAEFLAPSTEGLGAPAEDSAGLEDQAAERRSTVTSTVARTAAATAARQRQAAERAAIRLAVEQVGQLPDVYLVALAAALLGEVQRRGLALEVP